MGVKRPVDATDSRNLSTVGADPGWSKRWPALCSHLFDNKYDDGTPRVTSTLMILAELGVLKVCLNDRDAERSAWVSGRGVDEALDALEVGLVEDRLDWRARPPSRGSNVKRK